MFENYLILDCSNILLVFELKLKRSGGKKEFKLEGVTVVYLKALIENSIF